MIRQLAVISCFFAVVASKCESDEHHVCIRLHNKCKETIWPGIQGSTLPDKGGFELKEGQSKEISVPNGWHSSRIWARTGCDKEFNCDTGFCGNKEQCEGRGGVPPVSLAEFTLNSNGQDYYDVSLVDGYNLPIVIYPLEGTFKTNGGNRDCKKIGECHHDINHVCPKALKIEKHGKVVACKSACLEWNTDEYCCKGSHATKATCPRNSYAQIFKNCCPTSYSYAYDDDTSLFFCRGNKQPSPAYAVEFC